MLTQKIHDNWSMRVIGDREYLPAAVPGSVYADLLRAGRIGDPFWRDNELGALKLMERDFEYTARFDAEPLLFACERILLRCEGLDTLADLVLNGTALGSACNMHRVWEFDVKSLLRPKDNVLALVFHSPTRYIKEQDELAPWGGVSDAMDGFPHIRKAHFMFGWDWGPRLPDAGIWRDILLLGISGGRLEDVTVTQRHESGRVFLDFSVAAETTGNERAAIDRNPDYQVTLTAPDGTATVFEDSPATVEVENPALWWPRGYGAQPLYGLKVELLCCGRTADVWEKRIGLRTMTVRRQKDEFGESFAHEVNGVAVFAMGADYIPEDNLLSRVTPERTRRLLESCALANFNTIRVWGGGVYPGDAFYDLCDEMGFIVWQDLMFACAVYELTPDFTANIKAEIRDNVKRLRHHASLGLWCGNNEMEMFVDQWHWVKTHKQKADYIRMYEYLIPELLRQLDPAAFYWPASPSSGGGFDNPNDPDRGDTHYWEVWHGNKPFSEYRKHFFRYASEFGFQSFPCLKTIESFTMPEDRNVFSYVMEKHQRNNAANGKILCYLQQTFLYPTEFDTLLYASQLLQAEAIRYGVEHWRRHRGRCMGAVYWQLNDCWPVASWSSVDYFGRWKALHYYARRFFAPLLLSCHEEGIHTQDSNVNCQPREFEKSVRLHLANESMERRDVTVKWALRDASSRIIGQGDWQAEVPALSGVWFDKLEFPDADPYGSYVSYELYENSRRISGGAALFSAPKHFRFLDPALSCRIERDTLVLIASAFAKSVEITGKEDLLLSDNYFDMNAGEEYRVRILEGNPADIRLRSVYDIR